MTNLGRRWRQFRRGILARDNRRCQKCGTARKLEVHHRIPRRNRPGLTYSEGNCVTWCRDCHIEHHRRNPLPPDAVAWREYMKENAIA